MKTPKLRRHDSFFQETLSYPGLILVLIFAVTKLDAQALPDAPLPACPVAVSGTISDSDGDAIPFAKVSLIRSLADPIARAQQTIVGEDGLFTFRATPGPTCLLRVSADGFLARSVPVTSPTMNIKLVASDTADITVMTSREDMAEAQIHQAETQRIGGVIPNFYVAYDYHAVPLNKRQKFQLAYKTLINPYTNLINAGFAGIEQADNALPGYNQGAEGYAKRFGAATADTAIATMLSGAVLTILFRQDPRYFYMGKGTILHRTLYALSTSVIARGDNGKWQPAYAATLGNFGAGAISNLYYPSSDRNSETVTLYNGLITTGLDGFGNIIQEFVFKHFTPHAASPNP